MDRERAPTHATTSVDDASYSDPTRCQPSFHRSKVTGLRAVAPAYASTQLATMAEQGYATTGRERQRHGTGSTGSGSEDEGDDVTRSKYTANLALLQRSVSMPTMTRAGLSGRPPSVPRAGHGKSVSGAVAPATTPSQITMNAANSVACTSPAEQAVSPGSTARSSTSARTGHIYICPESGELKLVSTGKALVDAYGSLGMARLLAHPEVQDQILDDAEQFLPALVQAVDSVERRGRRGYARRAFRFLMRGRRFHIEDVTGADDPRQRSGAPPSLPVPVARHTGSGPGSRRKRNRAHNDAEIGNVVKREDGVAEMDAQLVTDDRHRDGGDGEGDGDAFLLPPAHASRTIVQPRSPTLAALAATGNRTRQSPQASAERQRYPRVLSGPPVCCCCGRPRPKRRIDVEITPSPQLLPQLSSPSTPSQTPVDRSTTQASARETASPSSLAFDSPLNPAADATSLIIPADPPVPAAVCAVPPMASLPPRSLAATSMQANARSMLQCMAMPPLVSRSTWAIPNNLSLVAPAVSTASPATTDTAHQAPANCTVTQSHMLPISENDSVPHAPVAAPMSGVVPSMRGVTVAHDNHGYMNAQAPAFSTAGNAPLENAGVIVPDLLLNNSTMDLSDVTGPATASGVITPSSNIPADGMVDWNQTMHDFAEQRLLETTTRLLASNLSMTEAQIAALTSAGAGHGANAGGSDDYALLQALFATSSPSTATTPGAFFASPPHAESSTRSPIDGALTWPPPGNELFAASLPSHSAATSHSSSSRSPSLAGVSSTAIWHAGNNNSTITPSVFLTGFPELFPDASDGDSNGTNAVR
ncbi:hypothetical protein THASP1DRAFT_28651 [Thamnocephalis sphaerospora]|uniref:Uncharacterized protein n=1 Tax=Thamnocephalis sphaerospora TaxID=78915 RepID=A0A4V1IX22_9FUNG|nr:hypothetical protein THASP1DRAFT_28651 [Thamnocephalis sphaerospora]|eukprot:RKP09549.1 hypothetical protein THASP1DRAFT_28651 [Thamnocephalis sphaerospora]